MKSLSRVAAALVVAVALSACDQAPDPAEQVKDALEAAAIEDVNVNYDRDSKAIHLRGSVESAAIKQQAEQVAAKAVGTSGNILNELTVEGTAGESRADDLDGTIRSRLNDMVDADPTLKDRDVNFDVNNGAVEIKGASRRPSRRIEWARWCAVRRASRTSRMASRYVPTSTPAGSSWRLQAARACTSGLCDRS